MIKSICTVTETALREAMKRLLAGCPVKTDGRLTVANLAAEAGYSRATVYRAPNILWAFEAATKTRGRHSQTNAAKTTEALKTKIAALQSHEREELRELRTTTHVMAQHIQALTLAITERDRQIAALHDELSRTGERKVVALGRGAGI